MNNPRSILIVLAIAALIGLFWWFGVHNQQPRYQWEDDGWKSRAYSADHDQPYGAAVFYRLLKGYFPNEKVTDIKKSLREELLPDATKEPGTYVFIGNGMFLDSADTQHLLQFVAKGHTALIISKTIPFDLMNYIYYEECDELGWDDYSVTSDTFQTLQLLSPAGVSPVMLHYAVQNEAEPYQWAYLPDRIFCDELPQEPLGRIQDTLINFAVFPHGEGRFLLHTTPLAFSNYQLLGETGQQYAAGVLSHLQPGPIWWDRFSSVPEQVSRRRNQRHTATELPEEHALSYILQQEPLAWAWYILLGMALLWMIFRARRTQRMIPVLPKNENASFDFIQTIAHLHFKSRNFRGISLQAARLFLTEVREKYGIHGVIDPTTDQLSADDDFFTRLSHRSNVPESDIRHIFDLYGTISKNAPSEQFLSDFYLSIEKFWKQAQ